MPVEQGVSGPPSRSRADIRIKNVLDVIHAEKGSLNWKSNWKSNSDGSGILTMSNEEWAAYESKALVASDKRTPEEKAAEAKYWTRMEARGLFKRDGEVSGGVNDRRANIICHGTGSWAADVMMSYSAGAACAGFVKYGDKITQVYVSPTRLNNAGSTFQTYYRYTNYVFLGLTTAVCETFFSRLINNYCQGDNNDTRGGKIEGYTGYVGSSWGSKSAEFSADPQAQNCNC